MADDDNATLWQMLRQEFVSFLGGGNENDARYAGLQMITTPTEALWDDPQYGKWLAWSFANAIPLWGNSYIPSADNTVTKAYWTFLTNIDVPVPNNEAGHLANTVFHEQILPLVAEMESLHSQALVEWEDYNCHQSCLPPEEQESFDSWFARDMGTRISTLETQYHNYLVEYTSLSNRAGVTSSPVSQALSDYNNPAYQQTLTNDKGVKFSYRTWNLQPNFTSWLKEAESGQGTALRLEITKKTGDASFANGFISTERLDAYHSLGINTQSDFNLIFAASAFVGIKIKPGGWFHQNLLLTYKHGPFKASGFYGGSRPKAVFWGPEGTYALSPVVVYMAYQPTVRAILSEENYSSLQKTQKAGETIIIGPFAFGGDKASRKNDIAVWDDQNLQLTLSSKSQHPQIMAVLSQVMPGN